MKLFTGWVMSAGLVLAATSANAQTVAPTEAGNARYQAASDVGGPYAAMPPEAPGRLRPALAAGAGGLHGRPRERVFAARNSAAARLFLHHRGDRPWRRRRTAGDRCPRRTDRPLRAGLSGGPITIGPAAAYGPRALPPVNQVRGVPRPPASVPHVASRTPSVPLPRAMPPRAGEPPVAAKPDAEPAPQSMAMQAKPAEAKPAERVKISAKYRTRADRAPNPRRRSSRPRRCRRCRGWSERHSAREDAIPD